MLKLILFIIFVFNCYGSSQLKIYVFDVGQADSQLIVFPSGYSILIDAGETATKSTNCKRIADKIQQILGKKEIDVGVATHLHMDHIGYAGENGFWYLMEKAGFTFKKFIDRNSGTIKNPNDVCDDEDDINWNIVGTTSSTAVKWLCYATNGQLGNHIYNVRKIAEPCNNLITPPDSNSNVEIVIVDALGTTFNGESISRDTRNDPKPASENDYSISLRIQYGDFVYATAGDLDGQNEESSYGYLYHDIETPYKDVVGEVDLYHANHHGSSHSSNSNYVGTLKPTVSIISCGSGNSYGHPAENSMNNMNQYSSKIYITEDCNPSVTDKFSKAQIVNNDIVVSYSLDSSSFSVSDSQNSFKHNYNVKTNKPSRKKCGVN